MISTTKVDQVPKLYLRGALINITLKNLTSEQRDGLSAEVQEWFDAPELESIRQGFIQQLRSTIGGEYHNPEAASQEFRIALMKGLCYLRHHCKYTIKCGHCGSKTHKGRKHQRLLAICPSCEYVKYNDKLMHVTAADKLISATKDPKKKEYQSAFVAIPGSRSAIKSDEITGDRLRMVKFLTKIAKNYIKQQLAENKITKAEVEHRIDRNTGDYALRSHLEYTLAKLNINHDVIVQDAHIVIKHELNHLVPLSVIEEINAIRMGYAEHGVKSEITNDAIIITIDSTLPVLEAIVKKMEVVKVTPITNDKDNHNSDSIMFNSDGAVADNQSLELEESLEYIRANLSGKATEIFEIFIGEGPASDRFKNRYGHDEKPHLNKIGEFMNCNTNAVKSSIHLIRKLCVQAGLVAHE